MSSHRMQSPVNGSVDQDNIMMKMMMEMISIM